MAERGGLSVASSEQAGGAWPSVTASGEQAEDALPSAAAPGAADEPTLTSAAGGAVAAACMEEIVDLDWIQVG